MIKKKIVIEKANRLYQLPPGISDHLAIGKRASLRRKIDNIDLASFKWPGDVDQTNGETTSLLTPATDQKLEALREAVAEWIGRQHGIKINPRREVFVGGRLGKLIFSVALAFVENGDLAFVPELGLPMYRRAIIACGGEPANYPISPRQGWAPDFERLNTHLGRVARLLFLNNPHNPTGNDLTEKEMAHLAWLAGRDNLLIVNDAAYYSVSSRPPVSLLAVPGGRKVGVELYSFSYLLGLPPLPFGFVVGNREAIDAMKSVSQLLPDFIPEMYADLALTGLRQFPSDTLKEIRSGFSRAAAEAETLLDKLTLESTGTSAVPFLWARIEKRSQSNYAARVLRRRSGILAVPGTAFGEVGEGFLRFSLTAGSEAYRQAAQRIDKKVSLFNREADNG